MIKKINFFVNYMLIGVFTAFVIAGFYIVIEDLFHVYRKFFVSFIFLFSFLVYIYYKERKKGKERRVCFKKVFLYYSLLLTLFSAIGIIFIFYYAESIKFFSPVIFFLVFVFIFSFYKTIIKRDYMDKKMIKMTLTVVLVTIFPFFPLIVGFLLFLWLNLRMAILELPQDYHDKI